MQKPFRSPIQVHPRSNLALLHGRVSMKSSNRAMPQTDPSQTNSATSGIQQPLSLLQAVSLGLVKMVQPTSSALRFRAREQLDDIHIIYKSGVTCRFLEVPMKDQCQDPSRGPNNKNHTVQPCLNIATTTCLRLHLFDRFLLPPWQRHQ